MEVHHREDAIVDQLVANGVLREGHFSFRSNRHSAGLVDRDLILSDPCIASRFGYAIAKRFFTDHIETVATPSIWGAGLAQWIAYFLEPRAKVVDATPTLRGLTVAPQLSPLLEGRRLLLVDNMILTGHTMNSFEEIILDHGATVIGVATLWNSAGPVIHGTPVFSVLNPIYPAWEPTECPACQAGLSLPEPVGY